jgi:molybdate transport system substrate-binding protein
VRRLAALLAALAPALSGCGGDGGELKISAASSLKTALDEYGAKFDEAQTRFSFAGSDELAAQIRRGAKPDVFAAANTKLPDELHEEGLVERPVTFAGNRLVLAVPSASDTGIAALRDVERPGTTIAVGAESVPVGAYTRTVLAKLPESARRSPTWRGSSASSPRAPSTRASCTCPTCARRTGG